MIEKLNTYNIVLFSASPRRKELLEGLGIRFSVESKDGEENFPQNLSAIEIVKHIALQKLENYPREIGENDIVITADTIVVVENQILGKPDNRDTAIRMLLELSDKEHSVITAFTISNDKRTVCSHCETKVRFRKLDLEEIEYYVDNFKPYDKAGAYGIQEWIGYVGIDYIEGSFYNVMGLPVQKLYNELRKLINN